MRPGYLVIGTKRGGSTSVSEWIAEHPQVAPCRTGKGSHYFDVNHHRGEAWFRSAFPPPAPPWRITGEGSPYYMFHPLAPQRIAEALPEVKLIAVLRDPVERAWSHHKYEAARGKEELSFEDALDAEPTRLAGERERMIADPSYDSYEYRYHAYLARGHYAEQLAHLGEFFPQDQILVLKSEDLFAHPSEQLARVWDFLGLDQVVLDGLRAHKVGASSSSIPEAVAQRLSDYYAPHNDELFRRTGIDFRRPPRGGDTG
jgi:hypothetical protein